jgi:hypothetical protein
MENKNMGAAFSTLFLVAAAIWAWCIVLWGWSGNPFEFVPGPHAQDAAPAALPHDLTIILQHYEKIFQSWAMHANLQLIAGVGVVWIVAWMAIKMTRIHVENPRVIHHYHGEWRGQELEQKMTPPKQLEAEPSRLPVAINQRQR